MEVICPEDKVFYFLLKQVVDRLIERFTIKECKLIPDQETVKTVHTGKAISQKITGMKIKSGLSSIQQQTR